MDSQLGRFWPSLRAGALWIIFTAVVLTPNLQAGPQLKEKHRSRHVLLISVDGLHSIDLINWVKAHPGSTLAELTEHGYEYSNTSCPKPSDSFPGTMALITGGSPNATGIWYDVSYDRTYLAPGSLPGATPGTVTTYDESIDLVKNARNYTGIGDPNNGIDLTALALNPANGNKPVLPWELLRVNTIFEVAHAHGLRTAWSDKHAAAYQIVRGPSGLGVNYGVGDFDYYSPEVTNSVLTGTGVDFTTAQVGPNGVQTNDELKVKAIVNECKGFDHTGTHHVGTPAIFGMNFQAVSVGEKLAKDPNVPALTGGYKDADGTPGPALDSALHFVDESLGDMVAALKAGGVYHDTTIIVTAKHGQSPIDVKKRIKADDSFYATALNTVTPGAPPGQGLGDGIALSDDTEALIWLPPGTQNLTEKAVAAIRADPNLNFEGGVPGGRPLITDVLWGDSLKRLYNDPTKDSRTPDIIVIVTEGVIYTGGSKLAEHGGFNSDDTSVALLVSHPRLEHKKIKTPVTTFQVAPTILDILGLEPSALQAVQKEHTDELPGFDGRE